MMRTLMHIAYVIALLFVIFYQATTYSGPLDETRYTKEIKRDKYGRILRRADVIAAFKKVHPCPSTGLTYGACAKWSINHVIPLACGGKDAVSNMMWAPKIIKRCKKWWCIDRYERKVYERFGYGLPKHCKNVLIN